MRGAEAREVPLSRSGGPVPRLRGRAGRCWRSASRGSSRRSTRSGCPPARRAPRKRADARPNPANGAGRARSAARAFCRRIGAAARQSTDASTREGTNRRPQATTSPARASRSRGLPPDPATARRRGAGDVPRLAATASVRLAVDDRVVFPGHGKDRSTGVAERRVSRLRAALPHARPQDRARVLPAAHRALTRSQGAEQRGEAPTPGANGEPPAPPHTAADSREICDHRAKQAGPLLRKAAVAA